MAEWKDIPGYQDKYKINTNGVIKNKTTNREVKQFIHRQSGHLKVSLYVNGKSIVKAVHRLLAETFIPNPQNKNVVHHIDENKLNNELNNLMWITAEEHGRIRSEEYYKNKNETRIKNKMAREKRKKQ